MYFAPPLNWVLALRVKKLECCGYWAEKASRVDTKMNVTDRQTDGHRQQQRACLRIVSRGKNAVAKLYNKE